MSYLKQYKFLISVVFLAFAPEAIAKPLQKQASLEKRMSIATPLYASGRYRYKNRQMTENTFLETKRNVSRIFGIEPLRGINLELLTPTNFKRQTGGAHWTSAMYHRDTIFIRVNPQGRISKNRLQRALRHEYLHAVVERRTAGRCPLWIDEGLAQYIEGSLPKNIDSLFWKWLQRNKLLSFDELQRGFQTNSRSKVAIAYAQSFYAVKSLVNSAGISKFKTYFELLKMGLSHRSAFEQTFSKSQEQFAREFDIQMKKRSRGKGRVFWSSLNQ